MKNAMKRIMSILLVALLLVSALPLAASAQSILQQAQTQDPYYNPAPSKTQSVITVEPTPDENASEPTETQAAPTQPAANNKLRTASGTNSTIKVAFWGGTSGNAINPKGYTTAPIEVTMVNPTAESVVEKFFPDGDYKCNRARAVAPFTGDLGKTDVISNGWTVDIWLDGVPTIDVTISFKDTKSEREGEIYAEEATVNEVLVKLVGADWATTYELSADKNGMILSATKKIKYTDATTAIYLDKRAGGTSSGGTSSGGTSSGGTSSGGTSSGGTSSGDNSSSGGSSSNEYYNKFPYNVYLNIYKDTMVGAPDKTLNITNGAAIDGTVDMEEVKNLVLNNYNAKNSRGIAFDGLYLAKGTWVTNYVTDTQKYDRFIDVDKLRAVETVYINVMIDNATAKGASNSVADSSNPKTGDAIYAPIAILATSATALAAVMFFYNKKRMAQ